MVEPAATESRTSGNLRYALATLRIALGLVFLWAFLDKTFGLTWTTAAASAWLEGGHPTLGYLSSSYGPFAGLFKAMAGNVVVDFLFMMGLLGIGVSLTSGAAARLGSWSGVAMVLLMYVSHPAPWANPHGTHPFLDTHLVEAAALTVLALSASGDTWGLGRWWRAKVPKTPWLH